MIASKQERAERYLRSLSTAELLEFQVMIDEELSRRDAELEAQQKQAGESSQASGKASKGGGGYVELKTINGCGPYAYRRKRVNGQLTSEYIGKVKE